MKPIQLPLRKFRRFIPLLALATAGPCPAAVYSITAADSGFVNAAGRSSKNDGVILGAAGATFNYSAGFIDEAPPLVGSDVPRKNYFTFDLSGIPSGETIVSATLVLFNPPGGYGSPDPTETFVLAGTPLDPAGMAALAADLAAVHSILVPPELAHVAADLYPPLATTPALGLKIMSAADAGTMVSIPLSAAGLSYLAAYQSLGPAVLSGFLATPDGSDSGDEFVFGFTAPLIPGVVSPDPSIPSPTPTPLLTITTIPEPATTPLAALAAATLLRRRKPRRYS